MKRVPAYIGKGAAMCIRSASPSHGSSNGAAKSGSGGGGGGGRSGGGNISRYFDARGSEEELRPEETPPLPVRISVLLLTPSKLTLVSCQTPLVKSIVTQEDEHEAMEAMFQAQTANWEEAQKKMSQ